MNRNRIPAITFLLSLVLMTAIPVTGFAVEVASISPNLTATTPDSSLTRDLGPDRMAFDRESEGGVLPSLTIEGEDQISVRFERPFINLDLQPRTAPGLGWENTWDRVDLFPVVRGFSALEQSPYLGKPWMNSFAVDNVVIFRPLADNVDRWNLQVVDSRGRTAISFHGKGQPPETIAWDGRRDDGTPAWPGLIYTHVLETSDRAGNTRTYTGEGFELPPYRLMEENGIQLVVAGQLFPVGIRGRGAKTATGQDLIIEAASWLNQMKNIEGTIEVLVTARSNRQAQRLAESVARSLNEVVIGPSERIITTANVVPDAPDHGMVIIATR